MICSECNEKNTRVIHCLCRLCTQKIINNANELGKKQGARDFFDYIKKLQPKDLVLSTTNNEVGYFVMRKDLNKFLKNTERWGSPKNTIRKHKLNKKLRSDKK
jgi:hypothetical protein